MFSFHACSRYLPRFILTLFCSFFLVCGFFCVAGGHSAAQDNATEDVTTQGETEQPQASDERIRSGQTTIIVEAGAKAPKVAPLFSAKTAAQVSISSDRIEQTVQVDLTIVQGIPELISLEIKGPGKIADVQSETLKAWSVRTVDGQRYLDLHLSDAPRNVSAAITIRQIDLSLPTEIDITHFAPGDSVGFDSNVTLTSSPDVRTSVSEASGFVPLSGDRKQLGFHTSTGGVLRLVVRRKGIDLPPVELTAASLHGTLDPTGNSMAFRFEATANVREAGAELEFLSGEAAISDLPDSDSFRLRLVSSNDDAAYRLSFAQTGTFDIKIDFVAAIIGPETDQQSIDFRIATGAVVPISIEGLGEALDFLSDGQTVMPTRDGQRWSGYLPASGQVKLRWKSRRKTDEGKLFFATNAKIESQIGAGLLRQRHEIEYQVLQGELPALRLAMNGPGEILDVQGNNLLAWEVTTEADQRTLSITLSRPLQGSHRLVIRSQTSLEAFPVEIQTLRLRPDDAIRHSGFIRLTNLGSVRLEPTDLLGLTQLSPEQYPGEAIDARQTFVYRFPSAEYDLNVSADRIQPEINLSTLTTYEVTESDRVIRADLELDIREAPIRDWEFEIPADYSIVSVTGANVVDYIASSEVNGIRQPLKVLFNQDVGGRQLISLVLEKNEPAAEGPWELTRFEFPDAKSVRGHVGVVASAGIRIAIDQSANLVEKPLSYFPKAVPGLQQAFRIRQPDWSATAGVELLQRNVQSDVFHLYSLNQETIYGSALINYFVTGAPVGEWRITVPAELGNLVVDGQDVRTWRREENTLIVSLHQPVMGAYTLLITFDEKADNKGAFDAAPVTPLDVEGERGFVQVVSPMQVELNTIEASEDLLRLDPLELPGEFRLLSTAPALGTWQYTDRPFDLQLSVKWFQPGTTVPQIVEFSEATSQVSQDGELVTDVLYYVKTRGQRSLKVQLPPDPVRLWQVSVDGQVVTARKTESATLIPLPGGVDPNAPVEVRLRLGKPTVESSAPVLALPSIDAPVLKTQWKITGDEKRVLVPGDGTVRPAAPTTRRSGFSWIAKHGLIGLLSVVILAGVGAVLSRQPGTRRHFGLPITALAIFVSLLMTGIAWANGGSNQPLELSVPVLSAGDAVVLQVSNIPAWQVDVSWLGLLLILLGTALVAGIFSKRIRQGIPPEQASSSDRIDVAKATMVILAPFLIATGILMQGGGATWFFLLLTLAILFLGFVSHAWEASRTTVDWIKRRSQAFSKKSSKPKSDDETGSTASSPATLFLLAFSLSSLSSVAIAQDPPAEDIGSHQTFDVLEQTWQISEQPSRLAGSAKLTLTGEPGDSFVLLRQPAILSDFTSDSLLVTKVNSGKDGLAYVVTIPVSTESDSQAVTDGGAGMDGPPESEITEHTATFRYLVESIRPIEGIPVLTGPAGVHRLSVNYERNDWEIDCPAAVRHAKVESEDSSRANLLLGTKPSIVFIRPQSRDVSAEERAFFVESNDLYLPGPGVVDGRHALQFRTAQGQIGELTISVPSGLTVSDVSGPIRSWRYDAEQGNLNVVIEPPQSSPFVINVQTQRGLDTLPTELKLSPLLVQDANGQVGLMAIGFGAEAQPESIQADQLSTVNLGDFDVNKLTDANPTLHRVYRYGADGGTLSLNVAPVRAEVRVTTKQVLSFGDERITLGASLNVLIARAGLFRLSFPLPDGFEIESLTGPSLHHWSEIDEDGTRVIVMHFNGKTIGPQSFALTLTGATPATDGNWEVPRIVLKESTRQTGELVVRPTTGIRLRTVARENVSETDPRSIGGAGRGALAFRLLQQDWSLQLGIEKLDPWLTGRLLHESVLREGQTRTTLIGQIDVQNASIRALPVRLPGLSDEEMSTLRANGESVVDFVRSADNPDIWEIQFKRRIVGNVSFRLEYERRGDRTDDIETLVPIQFPSVKQLAYYVATRAGGRLELEPQTVPSSWQRVDWNAVPQTLRLAGDRNAPTIAFRVTNSATSASVSVKRHALADSLRLRVAEGTLTTVLSSTGQQLTAVDLTMDVIQRSSLSVEIPGNGTLFNVFVNGESVNSIRLGEDTNTWQFYVLPGINDRNANVRFTYSAAGPNVGNLALQTPTLNVPLENIQWSVIAPKGFQLTNHDGDLELVDQQVQDNYDRGSYLSKMSSRRKSQAKEATRLLDRANELLQAGEQTKATWALNSVANQYALDAASNEDARVQLENLQTQQAIVGLNTRRQRLYLDNRHVQSQVENQQLTEAAAINPILQQNQLNFRPQQMSDLLRGNTSEDNAVLNKIAARLVQHQHGTEPAPQAITISLPEEGTVYRFTRSVQVAENAPLTLDLEFVRRSSVRWWQAAALLLLLAVFSVVVWAMISPRPKQVGV
ncbi:hypothetical protein [Roseiconus lacunae]|uniref:hypothetical protein n=1 Tax=Roseiconus lacunae TaxID=2605694 RepID=UPI001F36B7CF|nr:hypothetical protein [Roseiconus lacunae]